MALNPIVFTEKVVRSFLRYQLTAYPFADERLLTQMRKLLSLDETRQSPLLKGPYISLSRPFRRGPAIDDLVREGIFHPHMRQRIPPEITRVYGHQEEAIRAIRAGRFTLYRRWFREDSEHSIRLSANAWSCVIPKRPPGSAPSSYINERTGGGPTGTSRSLLGGHGHSVRDGRGPNHPITKANWLEIECLRARQRADYEATRSPWFSAKSAATRCMPPPEEVCSRARSCARLATAQNPADQRQAARTAADPPEGRGALQQRAARFPGVRRNAYIHGRAGRRATCLIRRLRAFCGAEANEHLCVATSATIVDRENPDTSRDFASRFFGVPRDQVATVGEAYCLQTFRNAFYHKALDRKVASERLQAWGGTLALTHEIPAVQPSQEPAGSNKPVNAAEQLLRHLLKAAGFADGVWGKQIKLDQAIGTTTPDVTYAAGHAEADEAIYIYLDGLSGHLHGNPATVAQDRIIRSWLRSHGHEVIEIAVSDLGDEGAMVVTSESWQVTSVLPISRGRED